MAERGQGPVCLAQTQQGEKRDKQWEKGVLGKQAGFCLSPARLLCKRGWELTRDMDLPGNVPVSRSISTSPPRERGVCSGVGQVRVSSDLGHCSHTPHFAPEGSPSDPRTRNVS